MNVLDQLPHITSRIEAATPAGNKAIGTGFFYNFLLSGNRGILTLVTNKHVISGAAQVTFSITRADAGGKPSGEIIPCTINNVASSVVEHPDANVDLAAFPVGAVINRMEEAGFVPFLRAFDHSNIPTDKAIQQLTAIEDILMVGYPTGIWDERNNLPVVRRGITATPYASDYEGRPEFMVDCACFPGSSGSPVVIANHGSYATKDTEFVVGSRLYLLGLLWGGPQYNAEGQIVAKQAPTTFGHVSVSRIPMNLGFCVKARMIRDLEPLVLSRFG